MPGRRFQKGVVTNFFANGGNWNDLISNNKFLYIANEMIERIKTAMNIQTTPALEEVLNYILERSSQAYATGDFASRYEAIQAVIGMMVWNPRHMTCDEKTGYLRRIPNRYAFNTLAELVAEAEGGGNYQISQNADLFLTHLDANTVRKNIICRFNEGVAHNNPLEPDPDSEFLCRQTRSNTTGSGTFAHALSKCPCHATAQSCGGDGTCSWDNAIGKCLPSTASTGGVGRRRGSKFRSLQNGRVFTTFTKGGIPASETSMPPPDLAAHWNAATGTQHASGGRRFYLP
jgi:hypothetical protein